MTVDVTVVKASTAMLFVKVGVGTCKQLQILDCCALLSPLNSAGWPLLMGTLDVLTGLVLEVAFFDVETALDEVLTFLLLVVTFLVLVVVRLVLAFFELDDFWVLVAFFTIGILLVVLGFFVDVVFLVLVVLMDTTAFARSFRSRLLNPALDVILANPEDDAVAPVLVDVMFEKKVPLAEAVVLVDMLEVEVYGLLLVVDTEVMDEDDDEVVIELEAVSELDVEAVSDVETEFEAVAMMAFVGRSPLDELLELDVDWVLEELTLGVLDEEEWTLLDELDGVMLDDNKLLLRDRICELELDRDEVKDGEATELLVATLLLIFKELLLVFVELLVAFDELLVFFEELLLVFKELLVSFEELLVAFEELLLFLLDVLVLFLLAMTLVSDALNELDVVAVTSLVTLLRIVNLLLHLSVSEIQHTSLK